MTSDAAPNGMHILEDLAIIVFGILASPCLLFRLATSRRWRSGLIQRFGAAPHRRSAMPCVWIHAVSVGEANAARALIEAIEREHPDWEVRVSTTTNTGQKVARKLYGAERCFYYPVDLSWVVRRVFRRVRPDVIVLMELEIWPNLLRLARKRDVPVVIVNGRMREKRVGRYRAFRFLFRPALDPMSPNVYCVQNETYRDRFARAGFPAEKIRVTGNMKYDAVRAQVPDGDVKDVREALGIRLDEPTWVAGCTWPGEEAICLRVHRELLKDRPDLRLVIAPRHIERADDVAREIAKAGFACRRRTVPSEEAGPGTAALLDTVGELSYVYSFADFTFVGKSITAHGGHNVLEPAALGVPTVFGPWTESFAEETGLLLSAGAAERVADENDLLSALRRLAQDACLRAERGRRGRDAVLAQQGATERHMHVLQELLTTASSLQHGKDESHG